MKKSELYLNEYAALCREADRLEPEMFDRYEVQRGLRDKNETAVVTRGQQNAAHQFYQGCNYEGAQQRYYEFADKKRTDPGFLR